MRATASSMRASGTSPRLTASPSAAMNSLHLSGTITMSMPAFTAIAAACA